MESEGLVQQRLNLFGSGIAHSLSPYLYSCVFNELSLPWSYRCVECDNDEEFAEKALAVDYLASNVTMPYKPHALRIADSSDIASKRAGGSNLLIYTASTLSAFNTDGRGAVLFLERCGFDLGEMSAVVCGMGVTGCSISYALEQKGAFVTTVSRSARTQALCYGSPQANAALSRADLIVDATPLGMHSGDGVAFDVNMLSSNQIVLDVVYGQGETALCRDAQRKGCLFFDGTGMLIGQAAVALPHILMAARGECQLGECDFFDIMEKSFKSEGRI